VKLPYRKGEREKKEKMGTMMGETVNGYRENNAPRVNADSLTVRTPDLAEEGVLTVASSNFVFLDSIVGIELDRTPCGSSEA
jgi:hypothetical protein